LCFADGICAFKSMMEHLRLNGSAILKTHIGNAVHQACFKVEIVKAGFAFLRGNLELIQRPVVFAVWHVTLL